MSVCLASALKGGEAIIEPVRLHYSLGAAVAAVTWRGRETSQILPFPFIDFALNACDPLWLRFALALSRRRTYRCKIEFLVQWETGPGGCKMLPALKNWEPAK